VSSGVHQTGVPRPSGAVKGIPILPNTLRMSSGVAQSSGCASRPRRLRPCKASCWALRAGRRTARLSRRRKLWDDANKRHMSSLIGGPRRLARSYSIATGRRRRRATGVWQGDADFDPVGDRQAASSDRHAFAGPCEGALRRRRFLSAQRWRRVQASAMRREPQRAHFGASMRLAADCRNFHGRFRGVPSAAAGLFALCGEAR